GCADFTAGEVDRSNSALRSLMVLAYLRAKRRAPRFRDPGPDPHGPQLGPRKNMQNSRGLTLGQDSRKDYFRSSAAPHAVDHNKLKLRRNDQAWFWPRGTRISGKSDGASWIPPWGAPRRTSSRWTSWSPSAPNRASSPSPAARHASTPAESRTSS